MSKIRSLVSAVGGRRCRGSACGQAIVSCGRGISASLLRGRQSGRFSSRGIAYNGLEVLVSALVGFPVLVSEGLVDGVDVELLDKLLVLDLGFSGSGGGHVEER